MKLKYIYLIFLAPSIFINYFTLTFIDNDHNLSVFSTILVCFFNVGNITFVILYKKYSFKKFLLILICTIFLIFILDFSYQNYQIKNSFQVKDEKLGWILNKSIKKKFVAKSKKGRSYEIDYSSADDYGFRYIDNNGSKKTILILGDSFTVGPFASNKDMYFYKIKEIFDKENLDFNWYVMGSAGWSTLQQYLYFKEKISIIKPDILIHQFCSNDFIGNSIQIEKNTYLRSQYIFRPYLINNEIFYQNKINHKIYKFLYSYSFIFKTIDNLVTNSQYLKNRSYFKKKFSKEMYNESVNTTDIIIKKIKKLIGGDKLYFIVNCYDRNNLSDKNLAKIISKNKIYSSERPLLKLKDAEDKGEDIFAFDGGHLNDIGNKIYGLEIAKEILKIIK